MFAKGKKLLIGMGAVYDIGERLHLIRPEHRYDGPACRQVFVHPDGDYIAASLFFPEQIEENLAAGEMPRHLQQGARRKEGYIGQAGKLLDERV